MAGKVLVVEDNEMHMELVCDLLTLHGFQVLRAPSGARAMVLAEEEQPDLILMDVSLKGMNGFEVTRILKRNPNTVRIPVLALTAYVMESDRTAAMESGCAGFVAKPINTRTFPGTVASFIQKGDASGER